MNKLMTVLSYLWGVLGGNRVFKSIGEYYDSVRWMWVSPRPVPKHINSKQAWKKRGKTRRKR